MMKPRRPARSLGQAFAWPLVLAISTVAGLLLGLTGDGLPDFAAWVLLASAPAALVVAWGRRQDNKK
ncbi:hypothetical protein [Altericroceibacterium xinjiangense]|uniref:hypothetical protein n=1 Tax=Altericroceibacterium xinjiangense TaxID=762261 RepID=UPI0019D0283F|nr:hypothetical protein [Altericroceibacterium xinjiangense]